MMEQISLLEVFIYCEPGARWRRIFLFKSAEIVFIFASLKVRAAYFSLVYHK